MKQTKKLLALVLATVMAFSLMAVTAAAYSAEEHTHVCSTEAVQRRLPSMKCDVCGTTMMVSRVYEEEGQRYVDFRCPNGHDPVKRIPY